MKFNLMLGASTVALSSLAAFTAANATPVTFSYTGSIVDWTVTTSGVYDLLAFGAQGGRGIGQSGGLGAEMGGDVHLTAGDVLAIAVGGMGSYHGGAGGGGGGGGGTFIVGPGSRH